jgi:hypothetical protein
VGQGRAGGGLGAHPACSHACRPLIDLLLTSSPHAARVMVLHPPPTQTAARRFMAPEALSSRVTPAADVWSAGVMAFQLLTGRLPFDDFKSPNNPSISAIWKVGKIRSLGVLSGARARGGAFGSRGQNKWWGIVASPGVRGVLRQGLH